MPPGIDQQQTRNLLEILAIAGCQWHVVRQGDGGDLCILRGDGAADAASRRDKGCEVIGRDCVEW